MDADLSRLPAGTSGWVALIDHALSLGDLAEVDYLELKGELEFGTKPSRKRSSVLLARAILGMANRSPDVAAAHLSGYGVVLVGVSGPEVVGAGHIDPAVLRGTIEPYLGEGGPQWDHQFVQHPQGLVLALTVVPPAWGDPVHVVRKSYSDSSTTLAVRDGEVLARTRGSETHLATSAEVDSLVERALRAADTGADLGVELDGTFSRVDRESVRRIARHRVDREAAKLLEEVPAPRAESSVWSGPVRVSPLMSTDRRSADEFRAEVREWVTGCEDRLEEVVDELLRHDCEPAWLVLRNRSDRYLEGVRVQINLPGDISVLAQSSSTYCDHGGHFQIMRLFPDSPAPFGSLARSLLAPSRVGSNPGGIAQRLAVPQNIRVQRQGDGWAVSWQVGDLPPQARVVSDNALVLASDSSWHTEEDEGVSGHVALPTQVPASWSVVARGVDHVFRGNFEVQCGQSSGSSLRWSADT